MPVPLPTPGRQALGSALIWLTFSLLGCAICAPAAAAVENTKADDQWGIIEQAGTLQLISPPGGALRISRSDLPAWARDQIVTVRAQVLRVGLPTYIVTGDDRVLVDGQPIARMGDKTATGGVIVSGSNTIFVNGIPAAFVGAYVVDPGVSPGGVPAVGGPIASNGSCESLDDPTMSVTDWEGERLFRGSAACIPRHSEPTHVVENIVPDVTGQQVAEASKSIRNAGFNPIFALGGETRDINKLGTIHSQTPTPGISIDAGGDVTLLVYIYAVDEPGDGTDDDWSTGERTDETGDDWSTGERSDEVDPCRGPRPEYEAALQNLKRVLQDQDIAALAPAIGRLRPECPGDVDLLTTLRDQAIALARAEVKANQTNMRSAVSNAKTRAQQNAQAWASALGTIHKAITEIERARAGTRSAPTSATTSTGTGAGTTSTTGASSSEDAFEQRCLIDYPKHLSPEGQGRSYRYYVQKQEDWGSTGVSAFTVLQYSSSVNQAPSIPGSTLDGPFYTYDAALAHMERLCPAPQR